MADPVIKIHENFTISDGTSSSAFTTGDADYTPITFANKLSTALTDNTVTFGATGGSGYLEFANSATLTGMPNYIFAIQSSDFFVKAGGRVNFRNVNLDADMTIDISKPFLSQSQIGENIVGLVSDENFGTRAKLNNDGTIFVSSAPGYDFNRGRVIVYKYKIPTSTEWNTADIVMKGTDTTQDPDKFYWTRRGAPLTGKTSGEAYGVNGDSFGASISIDDTGNFIVISAMNESKTNSDDTSNQGVGSLRVYEYKIPTSTEWDNADIYKDSDTNLESGKFYWTQVGNTIFGDDDMELWGYGASMNNDGSFISWCTRTVVNSQYGDGRPRLRVYQRDLTNTTTGWTQVGDTIFKDDTENSGGYGYNHQLNDAGDIILIDDQFYKTDGKSNAGKAFVYKYKIPTNTEWGTTNMVMKGGDTSQFTNKLYWTNIGEFSGYTSDTPIYSEGAAMNKTGSRVAFTCRRTDTGGGEGQIEVFEYSGSGTTWNQIGDIRGSVGITGASGKITALKGAEIAMNSTGNIIAFSGRENNVDGVTKPGIIGIAEYKNGNWEYIGNDIIGLNADDRLGATISIGGNKVAVGSSRFNGDSDGTYIGRGIVQVYQIEEQPVSNTTTISSGNYFINNFVSTIETGLVNYTLSYDAPNKRIIFNGISTDIATSITSTDPTVFDTSITEITSSNNTLPFITYGQPEPNYRQDGVIFFGTIKIHDNFTISDGTSSSAFTTGDADYTQITFANKLSTALADNTVTFGATGGSGCLEFANAATLTGMPNDIFVIPFSDFSVKAGGRVKFRNVNLDAEMTIATIKRETYTFKNDVVFTSNSAIIDNINLTNEPTAINRWVNEIDHYTNIINDDTLFPTAFNKVAINYDGSIIACADRNLGTLQNGAIQVYKRDTTASSGWIQIGSTILGNDYDQYGLSMTLSYDGQIVAGASVRADGNINGYFQAWKQDPSNTSVEPIGWSPHGDKLQGSGTQKWYFHHMSGDGNTIIWWSQDSSIIKIYKHNSGTNAWDEITHSFSIVQKGLYFRAKLSYDGSILVMGDMAYDTYKGRVQVYERDSSDQFTKIGSDFVGTTTGNTTTGSRMGASIAINKNGDVFSFNEHISGDWKNYVYKRDGSGWSQMGDISTEGYDGQHTMSLDDIGHSFTVGSTYHRGQPTGKMYIFEYNTSDSTWSHIITNNSYQGGGYYNGYEEGGNSAILGIFSPADSFATSLQLSGDNSKLIVCGNSSMHIYTLPREVITSTSSTLPAGDSLINNFVSKISTDMNQSLTYDADNASIIFDGISENIEISITSTDATVFDTSITEITAAEKTLPFITYGEPEPSYFQYSLNGITYDEFRANGISATELKTIGVIPGWNEDNDANTFDKSYVKGFMDVSGYMAIRNDYDMLVMGNTTIDGTINMLEDKTLSSSIISVNSRLFVNDDISADGKLYVGNDLSVNGQFSSNFADNSIPYSKVKHSPIITGDVKIGEDVYFNGPTVQFGTGTTLKLSGTTQFNDNTSFDVDNIRFSGTIVNGNMVFKDTTISSVIVNGSATASTVTSSDYRMKSNVTELNETHTVDKLEPIYYENTLTGNHEYGLIAHELQAEYPDLVINEKDGDEYQSVHYDGLIGVLVKEVQDLKKRLNVLNNK